MTFDGGYYLIRQDLIRGGLHKHTASNPDGVSDTMLRAVNIVQNTAWTINTWILDLMRECWVNGDALGVLPAPDDVPLPGKLSDELWDAMEAKDRAEHKYQLSKIHEENASLRGKREAFLRKLEIADSLRNRAAIWMPHFLDFRGRLYPMPQDLNPQGDDVARGLLMFSEGKPLGGAGIYWLAIRLANTFGEDKLPFSERLGWVLDHERLITDSVNDPLDGARFWTHADEPWSFLATCREWVTAHASGSPETFVSHLPIPLDGTCNGLQHLSLMGRDPTGARATNCARADRRHDLYEEIAEVVRRLVSDDAVAGVEAAHHWIGKVDRKVVKRAVMTTPYGVTERGIRDQLIADGHLKEVDGSVPANARYMQEKIVEALSETVVAAKEIMAYFQAVAGALAEKDIPLRWKTPAGMEISQSYWNFRRKRIFTLMGEFLMWDEDEEIGLQKRKQILASAPNVVHSFDAAMLAETAIRCHEQHGVHAFAFVHDSYGTHAADTTRLARVLRDVAADIYRADRLAEFEEHIRSYAPDVDLPPRPALGSFNVEEVVDAEYFFG